MSEPTIVQKGNRVYVHFVSKLEDGSLISTSLGKQPLVFIVGKGEVLRGLDIGVEGMKIGERKTFIISPEDAFGNRSDDLIREVPRYLIRDVEPHVGMEIELKTPSGRKIRGKIIEVRDKTVVVDANPPLAGQTLVYEVQVMKIE